MSVTVGRPALALRAPRASPASCPAPLRDLVTGLADSGAVSAAAAIVAGREGVLAAVAAGDARHARGEPLFDLASLTKQWTASLALRLDARGLLPLGTEVGELWPGCHPRLARRTLEELLRHRSGLRPWAPLYRRCRSRSAVARLLVGGSLLGARRGTYSDLDYVLWGLSAERALGRPLDELLVRELARPLGLRRSGAGSALPCRLGNEREVALAAEQGIRLRRIGPPARGRVQDGNARFLGPPAGHAGLFATPRAVLALAREWLAPATLWPAAAVRAALTGPAPYLGWRRPTRRGSGGPALGPGSYGHVGFTGGSLWLDPGRGRVLLLLAHRTAAAVELAPVRRRFHALALTALDG